MQTIREWIKQERRRNPNIPKMPRYYEQIERCIASVISMRYVRDPPSLPRQ